MLFKNDFFIKSCSCLLLAAFFVQTVCCPGVNAQTGFNLPQPGQMMSLSESFKPVAMRGIKLDSANPFRFNFLIDEGDTHLNDQDFKDESQKVIKYFLTSLTIPDNDLWVNLSPYEKDRIIPDEFGQTEMGRDLLAQDYILKQITASLIYPEKELGQKFWDRVYKLAQEKYHTTDIPINTFNKVWIVPDQATVYEHEGTAFVLNYHLKVMLEQDYLALDKAKVDQPDNDKKEVSAVSSEVVRSIVLPELEKEVNNGKNFASLRQIFYSLILATWYKTKLKQAILNQVYSDKKKINGVLVDDEQVKDKIYQQYLDAFKKGVFNYIKEDLDKTTNETVPRKYFSGGVLGHIDPAVIASVERIKPNELSDVRLKEVSGDFAMMASVEKRRLKELEILGRQTEPITITQLAALMQQEEEYGQLKKYVVRYDVARDERLKGHPKISIKELNVDFEAIEPRRLQELKILDGQVEPITINQLTDELRKEKGYEHLKPQDVRRDILLDKRFTNHPKLRIKEVDRDAVESRRLKELEILNRQTEPITARQLTRLLQLEPGYEQVQLTTVKGDVNRYEPVKSHPKMHGIDLEAVEPRRLKELKILNRQTEPIQLSLLVSLLRQEAGYEEVEKTVVRGDIVLDERLGNHVNLDIRERKSEEATETRRLKELEILGQQTQAITARQLLELLQNNEEYKNEKFDTVRNDTIRDERLSGHVNFRKTIDWKTINARRLIELEILNQQTEPITISQLVTILRFQVGYERATENAVRHDVDADERLESHPMIVIKEIDLGAVEPRRLKELEILDRQAEPIKVGELAEILRQEPGYEQVKAIIVASDVERDERFADHPKVKRLDFEMVEARRLKELEILNQQTQPITISQLVARLQQEQGYEGVNPGDVRNDVRKDGLLKGHVKLRKHRNIEVIHARRLKELEILEKQTEAITINQLIGRLRQEVGYENAKRIEVKSDVSLDEHLKGHSKLKKEIDSKVTEARRLKELDLLNVQTEPVSINQLIELLQRETAYSQVKPGLVKADIYRHQPLLSHPKLNRKSPRGIVPVKKDYRTDEDGKLVIKIYRASYRVYNFSKLIIKDWSWANRDIVPVWDNYEIKAFEVPRDNAPKLSIPAKDVIEGGIPIQRAIFRVINEGKTDENRESEVIVNDKSLEDTEEHEMRLAALTEIIQTYLAKENEALKIKEYMGLLFSLYELKDVRGFDSLEILEQAAQENDIEIGKAVNFLLYLLLQEGGGIDINIQSILPVGLADELRDSGSDSTDKAMMSESSIIKDFVLSENPGGIDLTSKRYKILVQSDGQNVNMDFDLTGIRNLQFDGVEFHIDRVLPVSNPQAYLEIQ